MIQVTNFDLFEMIGDRVLVKPKEAGMQTGSGLYLPPSVTEKENIQSGYIIKIGPGYPIPAAQEDEPWKQVDNPVKYLPLQVKEGDLAIYLQKHGYQIQFNQVNYVILPQSAILMVVRDESLFD